MKSHQNAHQGTDFYLLTVLINTIVKRDYQREFWAFSRSLHLDPC